MLDSNVESIQLDKDELSIELSEKILMYSIKKQQKDIDFFHVRISECVNLFETEFPERVEYFCYSYSRPKIDS